MTTRKKYLLAILAGMVCLFLCAACGSFSKQLSVPKNLQIDEYDILTWEEVPGAEKYLVSINDEDYQTDACKLDIFMLTATPGVYKISVSALGDLQNTFDSGWAKEISYEVPLPNNLVYWLEGARSYSVGSKNHTIQNPSKEDFVSGKIVIPSEYEGIPITHVASFSNCTELTGIILPDTVIKMGASFQNCTGLKRVRLPENLDTIGAGLFEGCTSLESFEIPENITAVDSYAFQGTGLKELEIPAGVTVFQTLGACNALTKLTVAEENPIYRSEGNCIIQKADNTLVAVCNNSVIPEGITAISTCVFEGCTGITKITVPNSVTKIYADAFANCIGLEELVLPSKIQKIPFGIISGCNNLKKLTVSEENPVFKSEGNCIIRKSDNALILGCKKSVIPDYVETIHDSAFDVCRDLGDFTIPYSVTRIKTGAFDNCLGLTSIRIPNSVTEIGVNAFYSNLDLNSVTIPQSVTKVGGQAFGFGTAYLPFTSLPSGWSSIWNDAGASKRNNDGVVYGCKLGYDGNYPYVESFVFYQKGEAATVTGDLIVPRRAGYRFAGWSTEENGAIAFGVHQTEIKYTELGLYGWGLYFYNELIINYTKKVEITLSPQERNTIAEGTTLYAVWIPENG